MSRRPASFTSPVPAVIETDVALPAERPKSKYQPLLDWCNENPGKWGRAATSGQYPRLWKNRGYQVTTHRDKEGTTWTYVRRPEGWKA